MPAILGLVGTLLSHMNEIMYIYIVGNGIPTHFNLFNLLFYIYKKSVIPTIKQNIHTFRRIPIMYNTDFTPQKE